MQKRHRKTRLGLAAALITTCFTAQAHAELKLQKYSEKLERQPVEIFVVSDDGAGERVDWVALTPEQAYPTPGLALPEMAARQKTLASVNANFFRESKGFDEPIGLVVHEGQVLSLPNRFYPTVGVIDGKIDWDDLSYTATIDFDSGQKTYHAKLCYFNAVATKSCAALWLNQIPTNLKDAVFIQPQGNGPALGRKTYDVRGERQAGLWAIQYKGAGDLASAKTISITIELKGKRLGAKWQLVREAISGSHVLTANKSFPPLTRSWASNRAPRTMVGVDSNGNGWVAVFDGRREASHGASVKAAWNFLKEKLQAAWAINLDGGGSSTMLHEGHLANKPSDGYPRPIAVGWGAQLHPITAPAPSQTK